MTDREVHKLKRVELLELLLELSKENEKLKEENQELKEKLNDRALRIENCGSLAEAALRICGVFEAAQSAADCYLENIKSMHKSENLSPDIDENSTDFLTEET